MKDFLGKGLKKEFCCGSPTCRTPTAIGMADWREAIDARRPKGRPIGIAYDEWNMWYAWNRRPLAVDAVYAAGFLHMLCRSAGPLGITMAAFFEPVNEGAILVGPAGSELSTMGEVFALLKAHQGGRLMDVPYSPDADVDALATASPDGRTIRLSLVNRRPDKAAGGAGFRRQGDVPSRGNSFSCADRRDVAGGAAGAADAARGHSQNRAGGSGPAGVLHQQDRSADLTIGRADARGADGPGRASAPGVPVPLR